MPKKRFYLRLVLLASVMAVGTGSLAFSQAGVDKTTVGARATAISADIDSRISGTKNDDAKKCLREKKNALKTLKGNIATAADLSSLLSELNAIAAALDSCTSGPNGGPGPNQGSATAPAQIQQKIDQGTPDPDENNPSVIIAPGPQASGPGVIDDGSGGGPDFGGTGGSDVGVIPVVPPPPVSPTM
jgi:hypothetical protein